MLEDLYVSLPSLDRAVEQCHQKKYHHETCMCLRATTWNMVFWRTKSCRRDHLRSSCTIRRLWSGVATGPLNTKFEGPSFSVPKLHGVATVLLRNAFTNWRCCRFLFCKAPGGHKWQCWPWICRRGPKRIVKNHAFKKITAPFPVDSRNVGLTNGKDRERNGKKTSGNPVTWFTSSAAARPPKPPGEWVATTIDRHRSTHSGISNVITSLLDGAGSTLKHHSYTDQTDVYHFISKAP